MKNLLLLLFSIMIFSLASNCDGDISSSSPCDLAPEIGPCEALIPIYFYNKTTASCQKFDWGGCEGVVPFDTLEECEACVCNTDEKCEE